MAHEKRSDACQPAGDGRGALRQRDYWAVLESPVASLQEVMCVVFERFETFAPSEVMQLSRGSPASGQLEPGEELEVRIRLRGRCRVRVAHRDQLSVTLITLRGHPEAGRITFGAYPNRAGDIVFHIRSRARAGSRVGELAFVAVGDPMQVTAWTGFINRVAATMANGVRGTIHVETSVVEEAEADRCIDPVEPTFRAVDRRSGSP